MRTFISGSVIAAFVIALAPESAAAQVGSSQNQQLMLDTRPAPKARKPPAELNTLNQLLAAMRYCAQP
jgi:hypothetical protein